MTNNINNLEELTRQLEKEDMIIPGMGNIVQMENGSIQAFIHPPYVSVLTALQEELPCVTKQMMEVIGARAEYEKGRDAQVVLLKNEGAICTADSPEMLLTICRVLEHAASVYIKGSAFGFVKEILLS